MRNKFVITGFSMIEMLISMVVASIVIMGVYSFLTSSQRSFTIVQANDSANRSMQLSNRSINDFIKMAGFRNYRRVVDYVFFPTNEMSVGPDGKKVKFASSENASVQAKSFVDIQESVSGSKRHDLFLRYYGSNIDDDLNYTVDSDKTNRTNNRIYDCNGEFRKSDELVVVDLYIDPELGLMCAHSIYRAHDKNLAAIDTAPFKTAKVVLDPNVTAMMFSARYDGDPRFFIPGEEPSDNSKATFTRDLINAVRYGFVVAQETHQKVQHLESDLVFHLLGYDDGDDLATRNEFKKVGSSDEHTIYNLVSGVAYMRNTIRENE